SGAPLPGQPARAPEPGAILCPDLGTLSFGDLARHIRRIGEQLAAAGITPQSRVGIALHRGPEAALLSVAICCSSTLVPINPNLASAELQAELERLRLDALVVPGDAALPGWATAAGEGFGLFKTTKATSSFDDIALEQLRPVRRRRPASSIGEESWAVIFRTSGTTGVPKRVPVTHRNLI